MREDDLICRSGIFSRLISQVRPLCRSEKEKKMSSISPWKNNEWYSPFLPSARSETTVVAAAVRFYRPRWTSIETDAHHPPLPSFIHSFIQSFVRREKNCFTVPSVWARWHLSLLQDDERVFLYKIFSSLFQFDYLGKTDEEYDQKQSRPSFIQLSGGAFLSCGILVLYKRDLHELFALLSHDSRLVPSFHQIGYILIGIGALIFILGLIGCCGSVRESRFLLGFVSDRTSNEQIVERSL